MEEIKEITDQIDVKSEQDIFLDSTEEVQDSVEQGEIDSDNYRLKYSGNALNEEELYNLSARKHTRIIYILGPVGCGKTTFETMIYNCFLRNIDDELIFAGSETLLAYEERLNNHRLISNNSEPTMERTKVKEKRCFLHLDLLRKHDKKLRTVVFSDISGEIFESCLANRVNLEENLANLDIAYRTVLFLDGSLLIKKEERHKAVSQIKTFLQTLKSSSLYHNKHKIDIVISKNDKIYDELKGKEDSYIDGIEKKFVDLKKYFDIKFLRIEAKNGEKIKDIENSEKLLDVLKYWLQDYEETNDIMPVRSEKTILSNEFNRFGDWC